MHVHSRSIVVLLHQLQTGAFLKSVSFQQQLSVTYQEQHAKNEAVQVTNRQHFCSWTNCIHNTVFVWICSMTHKFAAAQIFQCRSKLPLTFWVFWQMSHLSSSVRDDLVVNKKKYIYRPLPVWCVCKALISVTKKKVHPLSVLRFYASGHYEKIKWSLPGLKMT